MPRAAAAGSTTRRQAQLIHHHVLCGSGPGGLAVYSSDGEKLGEIIGAETRGGQTAVRAEMGPFLGLGPSAVLIDAGVFQKKGDRIELTLTAAEVRERVMKQNQKQGQ